MNYRTPLSKARGLGSAKSGTRHWWMQRVTALILIPLSFWMVIFIHHLQQYSYQQMTDWLGSPWNVFFLVTWIAAVFYHAALGVQVVIEDYVHSEALKIISVWVVHILFFLLIVASLLATARIFLHG
ncbi:MAG: succinate dehydrogenase, hydrophobic membrane anchor protein [Gammaproteobacteria bacterium]